MLYDDLVLYPHRVMNFKTKGVIRYNPERDGLKSGNHNWIVIELEDSELPEYYRYQFAKRYGIQLEKPSWSPHISVVKGWELTSDKEWGWRDGEEVEFEYSHSLFWKKHHVWVNTKCQAMYDIQNYYGFDRVERGHLTIGRIPSYDLTTIPRFCDYNDLPLWEGLIVSPY